MQSWLSWDSHVGQASLELRELCLPLSTSAFPVLGFRACATTASFLETLLFECMCGYTMPPHMCGGQRTSSRSEFSPPTMALGTEVGSSGLCDKFIPPHLP